ncbi:MAG TPA: TonB-dependent receptor, partial [Bacteroidales bacterium]|nr:TonB-dependent receptor [Bacteroidales bacterium]
KLFDLFNVKLDLTYYDKHYADFAPDGRQNPADKLQSYRIPAYALLNIHLGTQLEIGKLPLSIYLNGNNLTDKVHILKGEDGPNHDRESFRGFWGFGRNFNVGVKLQF